MSAEHPQAPDPPGFRLDHRDRGSFACDKAQGAAAEPVKARPIEASAGCKTLKVYK